MYIYSPEHPHAPPQGVNQVIKTRDGYLMSVGDDKLLAVMIWNASSKLYEVIAKATCTNKAKTVEYDYTRRRIYVGCFLGTVDIFELTPTLELRRRSSNKWHTRECSSILYLPHHDMIITAGFDRRLLFYDCVSNKVLCSYTVASEFIRHIYYDDVGEALFGYSRGSRNTCLQSGRASTGSQCASRTRVSLRK